MAGDVNNIEQNITQKGLSASMKNATESHESKLVSASIDASKNGMMNESAAVDGPKPFEAGPMPMRGVFGDITNNLPPQYHQPLDHQTEMPEMFFGVSKPYFSNTYKKRENKRVKKAESKAENKQNAENNVKDKEQENKENPSSSAKPEDAEHNKDKKEKTAKARTQKNTEQKLAL